MVGVGVCSTIPKLAKRTLDTTILNGTLSKYATEEDLCVPKSALNFYLWNTGLEFKDFFLVLKKKNLYMPISVTLLILLSLVIAKSWGAYLRLAEV